MPHHPIAANPGRSRRVDLRNLHTYETPDRQLYALYQTDIQDKAAFLYEGDQWVCLVNIIHGTGEIRWHVPTWKSMAQQDKDDCLAIEHFDLGY